MPKLEIPLGSSNWSVETRARSVPLSRRREPNPILELPTAVRLALESPLRFEAMRRACTPDDRVVLVIDDRLPRLGELIPPILEHLASAGIAMENVTLLTPSSGLSQDWIDDLPDALSDVRTEIHDPKNLQKLSYLATTRAGRRLYLNRSIVDADQLVLLTGREYDPLFGYGGAEGFLFQKFCNQEITDSLTRDFSLDEPDSETFPLREEAIEVGWLLGSPFLVQVIEGSQHSIAGIIAGLLETATDGNRLLDDFWRVAFTERVGAVIATLTGDPNRIGFEEVARAAAMASRVVRSGGIIAILTEAELQLDAGLESLRRHDEPYEALLELRESKIAHRNAAMHWATAADQGRLYLAANLHWETTEELFATPLHKPAELSRLLEGETEVAVLIDAHRMWTEITPG
jgi:nickel-dependent lactate racemase